MSNMPYPRKKGGFKNPNLSRYLMRKSRKKAAEMLFIKGNCSTIDSIHWKKHGGFWATRIFAAHTSNWVETDQLPITEGYWCLGASKRAGNSVPTNFEYSGRIHIASMGFEAHNNCTYSQKQKMLMRMCEILSDQNQQNSSGRKLFQKAYAG